MSAHEEGHSMVGFSIGLGIVIVLGIAALAIDAARDHSVIDNSPEYSRMFEEGIIERKKKKHI
jgi:hypothetical protein